MSSAARDLKAERKHRASQREKLRELLLTGNAYTNVELARLVGQRFGGRLEELRKGKGGPALDVRKWRMNASGSLWTYQCVGTLTAPEDIGKPESLRKRLAVVRARLKRDHAEESALLGKLGGGQ